ncbi:MAG: chemotaxis protein CheW [Pseudomonadota bacterium]
MTRYKNIELDPKLAAVIRHMNAVEEYREVLQNLQTVWDNLTLLGQLSGTGTDMSNTRQAFNQLTGSLLNQLGSETLRKCVLEMTAKGQVAIDILVRNLFERTADIGFLATDEDIRAFIAEACDAAGNFRAERELRPQREALKARFAEYVAKYSVYSDIVLLDPAGRVLARLDEGCAVEKSADPLVAAALESDGAYVESYGRIDLLPHMDSALVYSWRVTDADGTPIGVLCLCFRFEDEMSKIFANLAAPDDWSVILLLDTDGRVIASSDGFHIPVGARVEPVIDEEYRVVRFAGREYLATTRPTHGYQGYMGPGWFGHVMLPVQHAFNKDASEMLKGIAPDVMEAVMGSTSLFGEVLRSVPAQADRIQRDLNRSVWNGNVRQSSAKRALNPSFSKILLWEISNTGSRTKDVFARSIANLHETVVSAILQDSRFLASLAIDIMDRNLYERANDCRWWALTSAFREILSGDVVTEDAAARITAILQTINGLYTVYSNLFVFDARGKVIAVSQPQESAWVGRMVGEDWARGVLALGDSQGYAVSNFAATPFYGGRHTYIYGAAIRSIGSPDNARVVGGVGIVFDGEPQFAAMLKDALPRDASGDIQEGCFGAFVDRAGRVIASTRADQRPGARIEIDPAFLALPQGAARTGIAQLDGSHYAVGARMSSGYREYKGAQDAYRNDVTALVFVPLCEAVARSPSVEIPRLQVRSDRAAEGELIELATFHVGQTWFGLRSAQVVEAVDRVGLVGVPGAGGDFAGYLMYQGVPIPVFDIRDIANAGPAAEGAQYQVIVLQKNANCRFGILADGLGEIPEVLASRLRAMPGLLAGGNVLAEAIVGTDAPGEEHLLVVLSVERIAQRLQATMGDDAAPECAVAAREEGAPPLAAVPALRM